MTPPEPAEAVLEREFRDAIVLWEEGANNDTYHETETVYDAWVRMFREHVPLSAILGMNTDDGRIYKFPEGRYLKIIADGPDQIRRAKGQS